MSRTTLYVVALVCLTLLTPVHAEEPAAPSRVMLVLDASGSMWGQIDERPKIEIAREVIGELLEEWPTSVEVGLMAYGHRRKGDCADIELLVPIAPLNRERMSAAIAGLNPKGKTPLTGAVRRAAEHLRASEEPATVVLISDGKETCDADPCAIGAELAMSGVDFTAHVIGFDVPETEQQGLRCLAERTGGMFLAADDAAALGTALETTVAEAAEAPEPVLKEPGEATVTAPESVPAGARFTVEWTGPDSRRDYLTIVAEGAKDGEYLDYAYTADGSPTELRAPDTPGPHEVRYVFGHDRSVLASAPIRVEAVEATVKPPKTVTAGASFEAVWSGPANDGDYITIVPAGAPPGKYLDYAYTKQGSPADLRSPDTPGSYEVRYITGQNRQVLARAPIVVEATTATVSPESVTVPAGSEVSIRWTGPDNKGDYVTIVAQGAAEGDYLDYTYTRKGSPVQIRVPDTPGAYEIRYVTGQSRSVLASAEITVEAVTATLEAPATVAAEEPIEVAWTGPDNKGDYITIVLSGADAGDYLDYAYTRKGSPVTVEAPEQPGSYEIRYITAQSRSILASRPITVQ